MNKADQEIDNIIPVITLYQPWATWIMRGWKTIETRTHAKFKCLEGKRIGIHAGMTTDKTAIPNPWLTPAKNSEAPEEMINGYIIGAATVLMFHELNDSHSKDALIDCGSVKRYGLFLDNVQHFYDPIPVKGSMGIWYFDIDTNKKVKKPAGLKLF